MGGQLKVLVAAAVVPLAGCGIVAPTQSDGPARMWGQMSDFGRDIACADWNAGGSKEDLVETLTDVHYTATPDETIPREQWYADLYGALDRYC